MTCLKAVSPTAACSSTSTEGKRLAHSSSRRTCSLVYPPIAEHTDYSVPEVHEVCKQMFLPARQMSIGDKIVTVPGSTARLTTAEMMDYIDRYIAMAHELGCTVM